jgi:hypothetical protein
VSRWSVAASLGVAGAAWLFTCGALADPAPAAPAQKAPASAADRDGKKRAEIAARLKALRADVLRKRVGLDAKKAAEVERVLERNAPERIKLQAKLRTSRRALQRLISEDSNDQQAFTRALQGLREAQGELQKLRQREMDELSKYLTPKEQAKLAGALRELHGRLRRKLRDYEEK